MEAFQTLTGLIAGAIDKSQASPLLFRSLRFRVFAEAKKESSPLPKWIPTQTRYFYHRGWGSPFQELIGDVT